MRHCLPISLIVFVLACGGEGAGDAGVAPITTQPTTGTPTNGSPTTGSPTYDVDANGIPKFAAASYIDLDQIARISRFRSGVGHDYSDAFESCRTMKHYFQPRSNVQWGAVRIYAPVEGTIVFMRAEQSFGTQVGIRSTAQPAFTFIVFHVNPVGVDSGANVTAGQQLGTHIGTQTMSDVAVAVQTPTGFKLVSWFDVITDELFATYAARGVSTRESVVIGRAERDGSRLACNGETYVGGATLESWVELK
ncbi:MAG TPA: hypothetical protein VIP11_23600 [Gemmatimonadaceae bacterium]